MSVVVEIGVGNGVLLGSGRGELGRMVGNIAGVTVLDGTKVFTRLAVEAGWLTGGWTQPANTHNPDSNNPATNDLLMPG